MMLKCSQFMMLAHHGNGCLLHLICAFAIIMSKQLSIKNQKKILPSAHKVNANSRIIKLSGKCGSLKTKSCTCADSSCVKSNLKTLLGNDGAVMHGCTCNKCLDVACKCQTCSTERNTCKDRKAAKTHLREHHQVTIENENAMKGNEIEESEEVDLGVDGDF